jgi:hypothetical protein
MAFEVHVAKLISSGKPFDVTLVSDGLVTVTVTVRVAGETANRKFGLVVNGEARPAALSQEVDLDGRADCEVTDWGTAPAASAVVVSGDAGGEHHDDAGVVLAAAAG